jgi:hypothetical protein
MAFTSALVISSPFLMTPPPSYTLSSLTRVFFPPKDVKYINVSRSNEILALKAEIHSLCFYPCSNEEFYFHSGFNSRTLLLIFCSLHIKLRGQKSFFLYYRSKLGSSKQVIIFKEFSNKRQSRTSAGNATLAVPMCGGHHYNRHKLYCLKSFSLGTKSSIRFRSILYRA